MDIFLICCGIVFTIGILVIAYTLHRIIHKHINNHNNHKRTPDISCCQYCPTSHNCNLCPFDREAI